MPPATNSRLKHKKYDNSCTTVESNILSRKHGGVQYGPQHDGDVFHVLYSSARVQPANVPVSHGHLVKALTGCPCGKYFETTRLCDASSSSCFFLDAIYECALWLRRRGLISSGVIRRSRATAAIWYAFMAKDAVKTSRAVWLPGGQLAACTVMSLMKRTSRRQR